jgi:hypothetical protein
MINLKEKQIMKHKHYDVIVAAAEGKVIQWNSRIHGWTDYQGSVVFAVLGFMEDEQYRIKPIMVDKWKWAYKEVDGVEEFTSRLYASEEEIKKVYHMCEFEWLVKLEPTKITVDET